MTRTILLTQEPLGGPDRVASGIEGLGNTRHARSPGFATPKTPAVTDFPSGNRQAWRSSTPWSVSGG